MSVHYMGDRPHQYRVTTPPKKRRWPILLAVLGLLFASLIGCIAVVGSAANSVAEDLDRPREVVYTVEGTGSANVTFTTGGGISQQDVSLPWSTTVEMTAFDVPSVSAQIDGSGEVACRIEVGGVETAANRSSGEYVIADCTGSLIE